jgi:hypothetical protein
MQQAKPTYRLNDNALRETHDSAFLTELVQFISFSLRRSISFIVILLIFLVTSIRLFAVDPVTVVVSLSPPYTPFLHEYAGFSSGRLQVTLIVNDSRIENFPARLQMIVERMNVGPIMQTHEYASATPILLNGLMTEVISGPDLAPYFLAINNQFTGFSQAEYMQTGRIPDGFYRIGFRVVHSQRPDVIISNTAYTQPGWFLLNDPPQLNLPLDRSTADIMDPQLVKLEWFPRHLGSLNAAFATSYRVELFPLRLPGIVPDQYALMAQPEFFDETNQTYYFLTPDKYLLEPGVEYAWRVRATAGNAEEITLFHNQGYSQVYSFTYGKACPEPVNVRAEALSGEKALITWDSDPMHSSVEVRFRLSGDPNATWHSLISFGSDQEITSLLSPSTTYEYQLRPTCLMNVGNYSQVRTFTTRNPLLEDFVCGVPDGVVVTNTNPLASLSSGDVIYSGKFPVTITEVSGGNGVFSGKGNMQIPFLNFIQVRMEFTSIKVNELYQVYEGEIRSIYNEDSRYLANIQLRDVVGEVISGKPGTGLTLDFEITDPSSVNVTIQGNNTVVITRPDGSTLTLTVSNASSGFNFQDSAGNLFHVDEDGNVSQVGTQHGTYSPETYAALAAAYNQIDTDNVITFGKHSDSPWAFDQWNEMYQGKSLDGEYPNLDGYRVPWKLIPPGQTGLLEARITRGSPDPARVVFRTPAGVEYFHEYQNNAFRIKLASGQEKDAQELYALYPETDTSYVSLGKVMLVTYVTKQLDAVIVPVGNVSYNFGNIQENLNRIYAPLGIEWRVRIDSVFRDMSWDLNQNDSLDAGESASFSMYSPEMRALNRAYSQARPVDKKPCTCLC